MLRTHHFNHPKGGVTPVKHKKGNMDAHYMSGSYFGEEKYHGENPDEVEEKESKEVTKAKNLLESKNKNKKKVDVTTNSTADNKEVVSKTSPGPGWTKTKGTNIWAPPIEDKKTNKSLVSTAVGKISPELLATLKKNPQNTATQEELASSKGRPIDNEGPKKQDFFGKTWETLVNPMQAIGQYNKYGELKDHFSKDPSAWEGEALDAVVDLINPFGYIQMASDIGESLDNEGATKANMGMLSLMFLTRGKVKGGDSSKITKLLEKAKTKFGWKPPKLDVTTTQKGIVGPKPKGGVGTVDPKVVKMNKNVDMYGQPNPTLYPTPKNNAEFQKIIKESTGGIGATGRVMDDAGITIKNLNPKSSVKNLGTNKSGQVIYEVTYPNGTKLKFWESTGSGQKPVKLSPHNAHLNADNSKGFFGVVAGNMDASKVGMSNQWFIKSGGWERGYGSKIIEDTGIWLKSLKETGMLK